MEERTWPREITLCRKGNWPACNTQNRGAFKKSFDSLESLVAFLQSTDSLFVPLIRRELSPLELRIFRSKYYSHFANTHKDTEV